MANSTANDHHVETTNSKSDEPEFDCQEFYSRDKTLELRDLYIP
jgi:hypothetical protein